MTRSFDVFFDLRLNQHLSRQWRRRGFETPLVLWNENTTWPLSIMQIMVLRNSACCVDDNYRMLYRNSVVGRRGERFHYERVCLQYAPLSSCHCVVWSRGLTTCQLYVSDHLSLYVGQFIVKSILNSWFVSLIEWRLIFLSYVKIYIDSTCWYILSPKCFNLFYFHFHFHLSGSFWIDFGTLYFHIP